MSGKVNKLPRRCPFCSTALEVVGGPGFGDRWEVCCYGFDKSGHRCHYREEFLQHCLLRGNPLAIDQAHPAPARIDRALWKMSRDVAPTLPGFEQFERKRRG